MRLRLFIDARLVSASKLSQLSHFTTNKVREPLGIIFNQRAQPGVASLSCPDDPNAHFLTTLSRSAQSSRRDSSG